MKKNANELMSATLAEEQFGLEIQENSESAETRSILMHHLSSFQQNDLESVISDYTSESILITQEATYTGPREIKGFFAELMAHFPIKGSRFILDKMVVQDEFAYIVWHANTPSLDVPLGSDTFVVKDGKIHRQTFAGQMNFKS